LQTTRSHNEPSVLYIYLNSYRLGWPNPVYDLSSLTAFTHPLIKMVQFQFYEV
jgi:hypothetical protein